MKKILFVSLLALALPAFAAPEIILRRERIWVNPVRYRISLNPVLPTEYKQHFVFHIRNRTHQPQYQVEVYVDIYLDEAPGTPVPERPLPQHRDTLTVQI